MGLVLCFDQNCDVYDVDTRHCDVRDADDISVAGLIRLGFLVMLWARSLGI